MANNRVAETNPPKATVPPKSDTVNTEKPKNKTIGKLINPFIMP